MKLRSLAALSLLALAVGCTTQAPASASADGLVPVPSSRLDELFVVPGADLSAYRKVLIDAVPVEMRSDWLNQRHAYNRIQPMYPRYKDADRVRREAAASIAASLAQAFRASGHEIVEAPEPGVMRISARGTELFINAPDIVSPWYQKNLTRDAGEATLLLEARDAVSGTLLARVVHHAIARQTPRANLASDPLNALWMDALFGRWTQSCATELNAPKRAQLSLRN
jgi:hypothetical protein